MENLNKENFWNEQQKETPEAVELFDKWFSIYKDQNDFIALFNSGIYHQTKKGIQITEHRTFCQLPLAMQLGILQQFKKEKKHLSPNYNFYFMLRDDMQEQIKYASSYFKNLQTYLTLKR